MFYLSFYFIFLDSESGAPLLIDIGQALAISSLWLVMRHLHFTSLTEAINILTQAPARSDY